jgi:cytochrome d ubiquinol oxidase subunit I
MVGAGTVMLFILLYGMYLLWKKWPEKWAKWLKWIVLPGLGLPILANSTGWILTENGRQPWIVQDLLRVEDAVSPNVSSGMILFSLIGFLVLYGILIAADVYLLAKFARVNPEIEETESENLIPSISGSEK